MCLGIFPPELWEVILCYVARESLVGLSRVSLCCNQVVQSQLRRRIAYHFSSDAPYTLKMILSDPATMERNESLALVSSPISLRPSVVDALRSAADWSGSLQSYTFLDVHRGTGLGKCDELYSKIIQLDELDFLYLLFFDIHRCRPESLVSVGNLCGGRMRLIRLWKKWFSENRAPHIYGSERPSQRLFTKLVWAGPNFDIGLLFSATETGPCAPEGSLSSLHVIPRPGADAKFYRVRIEKMLVRDQYLLGLLEGFNSNDR